MRNLLAILVLLSLATAARGQFGVEQPFFFQQATTGFDWQTVGGGPYIRYEIDQGLQAVELTNGCLLTGWTNQGWMPNTGIAGAPRWFETFVRSTNSSFAAKVVTIPQPMVLMTVQKVLSNGGASDSAIFGDAGGNGVKLGPPNADAGNANVYFGANLTTDSAVYTNAGAFFLLTVIVNGSSSSIRINGAQVKAGNVGGNSIGGASGFGLGYSPYNEFSYANCDFKRFLLWTNTLTAGELSTVEQKCMDDFGL